MSEVSRIVYRGRDELMVRLRGSASKLGPLMDEIERHVEEIFDETADRLDAEREADRKGLVEAIREADELLRYGDDAEEAESILSAALIEEGEQP